MEFTFNNLTFDYNSKVIISYLILSLIACFLNFITRGKTNKYFFSSYRSSPLNPLTYIRMITHSIGHINLDHLISNFLYILLVGPMIEEKYGSINLLIMLIITSIVIAIEHYLSMPSEYSLSKASCFMTIVNTLKNKIIQHVVHIQI